MPEDAFTDNFDGYIPEDAFTNDLDGGVWLHLSRAHHTHLLLIPVFTTTMNAEGLLRYRITNTSLSMLINFPICTYTKEDTGCFNNTIHSFFFCRKHKILFSHQC